MSLTELFTYSFYFFFGITYLTKITLIILNISHMKKNFAAVPKQFEDNITLEQHQKAQKYTIDKNKLSIISIIINAFLLLFWLKWDGLVYLFNFMESLNLSELHTGVLFIIGFSMVGSVLDLPEKIYSTFYLEAKYGFNKTTPKIFITDQVKGMILGLVIGVPFLYAILTILNALGEYWWLYTFIFILSFQFILVWAYPKFIAPLFNKFKPLEDEELKVQIDQLAQKADINFEKYFVMDASMRSSHGNAYFTGFGKNKRVVFFDTLLKTLNNNEVISVLAHELGHMKKKHILKSLFFSSLTLLIGLYVLNLVHDLPEFFESFGHFYGKDYLAITIFTLVIPLYTFFLTPIFSWLSRKNEFEADEFAATHTVPRDLINALLKMYRDNSSSLTPHPVFSKFYYSHPPANERVNFLASFETESNA